ncbi:MAG: hypothetical protein M3Q64_01795 [bacterium]|nr:hypothetical protein [bacterium]
MKQVHFTLYGKGGAGKSFVANLIAQYLHDQAEPVADMKLSHDVENYDSFFDRIIEEDANFVVDNYATATFPLRHYISESDAYNLMAEHGKEVVMHIPITSNRESYEHFDRMLEQVPENIPVIVWLNEFYGKLEPFENSERYLKNKDRIRGVVHLAKQMSDEIYCSDLSEMFGAELTFNEANKSPDLGYFVRHRLNKIKESIFQQMGVIA